MNCVRAGVLSIGFAAWYVDSLSKPRDGVLLRDKAVFITGCDTGTCALRAAMLFVTSLPLQ